MTSSTSWSKGQRACSRGPHNLSRAKVAVHKMMQQVKDNSPNVGGGFKRDSRQSMFMGPQELSRKEKRKQARKVKKSVMKNTSSKLASPSERKGSLIPGSVGINEVQVPGKNREKNKRKKRNRMNKLKQEQEAVRKQEELAEANKEDERAIKRLEKELHFRKNKKTKSNITPSIFKADGLDYLLDLVNSDSDNVPTRENLHGDNQDVGSKHKDDDYDDDGDEFGEMSDSDSDTSMKIAISEPNIHENNGEMSRKRTHPGGEDSPENNHAISKGGKKSSSTSSEVKMDPYGNVIGENMMNTTGAYVPPQKRAKMMGQDDKKQEHRDRLRKQLKGLINRLSETNVQSISAQVEELYQSNSRNDMNEIITSLIMDACIGVILIGERLVMEHVMLLAILNSTIGNEVGAYFIQTLACKFDELYQEGGNYGPGKYCDNVVLLFTHLYNFKVIHCSLLYDIVRKLVDGFTERDVEMLLLILKNAGMMLRKDDPSALKEIIVQIQGKANTCSLEFQQQSRVKFMLETIYAIRNNNVHKILNYDPAELNRMKKILRSLSKGKGHTDSEGTLRISLDNLLHAEERGRWWIIGSSWAGNQATASLTDKPLAGQEEASSHQGTKKIVELSRQQRMNTGLRKAIFSIVMTAEDYADAFGKILHADIRGGQEKEVVHVIINCCLQEATFNPYYAHLGSKLCHYDRKYKMAFQFAYWDKLKILNEMTSSNQSNLAHLLSMMFISKALSISILKVIEFADIDKSTVSFLRQMLQSLLVSPSQEVVVSIFSAVISATNLQFFREGLRLFLLHFMLPKNDSTRQHVDQKLQTKLKERVQLVNKTLAGGDTVDK